jgi:hypothetical protein
MLKKGSLLLIVTIFLAAHFVSGVALAQTISKVMVSNPTSARAVISWVTDVDTDGTVDYGMACDALGSRADDKRGAGTVDDIHYVEIVGLNPGTPYFFSVTSGGVTDDNNGQCYSFTTAQVGRGVDYILFGTVYLRDGVTPAGSAPPTQAIKYVTIQKAGNGAQSYPLSALTGPGGGWDVNLADLKDPTTNGVFAYATGDTIILSAEGGAEGTASDTAIITGTSPQPVDDEILPIELSALTAVLADRDVIVQWRTESEINNLGFDVYRSESPDGKFIKVNPAYIKGAGTDATPHDYEFVDESAVVGKTYYYYLESISFSGEREQSHIIKVIIDVSGKFKVTDFTKPATFALLQNFPNPFNPETWIPFRLAKDADVTIRVFDIRGQEIRTIHLGQKPAGYYDTKGQAVLWDGRDSYGQEVSSGIYFYSLTAGKFHATRKLTIIK